MIVQADVALATDDQVLDHMAWSRFALADGELLIVGVDEDGHEVLNEEYVPFLDALPRMPPERKAVARETYEALYRSGRLGKTYDPEAFRARFDEKQARTLPSRPKEPELALDPARNPVLLVCAALAVMNGFGGKPWPSAGPYGVPRREPVERMPSVVLASALDMSAVQLASRLRPLGITPKDFRFPRGSGPEIAKGYGIGPIRAAVSWLA